MTVHIASIGMGRYGKRPEGMIDLAAEAAGAALEGIGRRPIDLLVAGSMLSHGPHGPEALLPRLASRLGLESSAGFRVDSASGTGGMSGCGFACDPLPTRPVRGHNHRYDRRMGIVSKGIPIL